MRIALSGHAGNIALVTLNHGHSLSFTCTALTGVNRPKYLITWEKICNDFVISHHAREILLGLFEQTL